jgi:hypothetical protein
MTMVMVMILLFLAAGARVEHVDRWVLAGLTGVTMLILVITYLRF